VSVKGAGIIAALLVTTGPAQAADAEPLRIAYVVWVGYGPLFVAEEKSFFADEGVEVHMINTEGGHWEAVLDGQVDALGTSINSMPMHYVPDKEPVCVLAMSESSGGDGILATKDIHSIADLKGRTVAFQELTVQQFYLNALLKESGLSEADIETSMDRTPARRSCCRRSTRPSRTSPGLPRARLPSTATCWPTARSNPA